MTDVPEHLLERSRQRRAALGLGGDAPAAPAASTSPAEAPAAAAAAGAAAEPAVAAPPPPPPPPARPAVPRTRVPAWVMPVLAGLPIWGFFYLGAFGERASHEALTPIQQGAQIYAQNCASCHGDTGGGGAGPALADGQSARTFPNEQDHITWVVNGSAPVKGQPYGAEGRVASGGMPGFGTTLTEEQIRAVVEYERQGL